MSMHFLSSQGSFILSDDHQRKISLVVLTVPLSSIIFTEVYISRMFHASLSRKESITFKILNEC